MNVRITATRAGGCTSYTLDASEWRAEVARLEVDPEVTQITARQVEDLVQYAYNRPAAA